MEITSFSHYNACFHKNQVLCTDFRTNNEISYKCTKCRTNFLHNLQKQKICSISIDREQNFGYNKTYGTKIRSDFKKPNEMQTEQ